MLKISNRQLPGLFLFLLFWGQNVLGAESISAESLTTHADASIANLKQLDQLAQGCIDDAQSVADSDACNSFMQALDGDVLASYLEHCRVLKAWRDEFVVNQVENNNGVTDQSTTELQNLAQVEYACGENALQKRTEFVIAAFTTVRAQRPELSASDSAFVQRQLKELQFGRLENQLRQDLLIDSQRELQRLQLQSQQQFEKLENELIRQQINRQQFPQ